MKQLLLIRHAQAANPRGVDDFERPLTHSGLQDAAVMAQRLHAKEFIPQMLLSSPALRTHTTANIFAEHLSVTNIHTDGQIYDASEVALLHVIDQLPDEYDIIALVGHNPGISEILFYLTGKMKGVPTCAVALIELEIDSWKEVSAGLGNLTYYDEP